MIIGDHEILDQGNWQNIQSRTAFSSKFSSGYRNKDNITLSTSLEPLNVQLRTKRESEIDLARQTGDPALYGELGPQMLMFLNAAHMKGRLLFQLPWLKEPSVIDKLHHVVLLGQVLFLRV